MNEAIELAPIDIYIFKHQVFSPDGDTIVCVAPIDTVISVYGGGGIVGEEGLSRVFRGAVFFRNFDGSTSYLGVWGARNASRFRSALRKFRVINLIHQPPPANLIWFKKNK